MHTGYCIVYSKDVLREDRAIGEPLKADKSNFLHPVIYYYEDPTKGGCGSMYT